MSPVSSPAASRPRICFVAAVPTTVSAFLVDHMQALSAYCDVAVVSDFSGGTLDLPASIRQFSVPIARSIRPGADLKALAALTRLFRRERFDVVHSITPKAGLLTGLAGRLAGVPARIHWFTGQVWVTRQGLARRILKAADRFIAFNATHRLVDSPSQRQFLIDEGVVTAAGSFVLAEGSVCGVDSERFRPDPVAREAVRAELGISDTAELVVFVGRLNRDKGVAELSAAFATLAGRWPQLHLLVIGPDEEDLWPRMQEWCAGAVGRLRRIEFTRSPERYMAAGDIFCLPSYREGQSMVLLEAAACGLPCVASRIYGITDAVADGSTGLLCQVQDADDLTRTLESLLGQPGRRQALGEAGRSRIMRSFSHQARIDAMLAYYRSILGNAISLPQPGKVE